VEHKSVKHVVMEYCGGGDLRKFLNFHLELWCVVALLLMSRYTPLLHPGCYAYCYSAQPFPSQESSLSSCNSY
jgi:hypothetical protein